MRTQFLLFGTAKGLVIFQRNETTWQLNRTDFLGIPISMLHVETARNRWWVSLAHKHWGHKLHYSDDKGTTWLEVPTPAYPLGEEVRPGVPATLQSVWAFASHERTLYAGTEPGGLFRSKNDGQEWELIRGLWDHPSRKTHWFGGGKGKDFPGIHSILIHPKNPEIIHVGISCAGVFATTDGGTHWQAWNRGLRADFLPNPTATVGHDPHRLLRSGNTDVLWQQNHYGVFISENDGAQWRDVSAPSKGVHYGFALAVSPTNPQQAWVIPAESDTMRTAVHRKLCVCRTDDGGLSWEVFRSGLPQSGCFDIALRHSLALSPEGWLAFGTNAGNAFVSLNQGEHWEVLSNYLPPVFVSAFA